MKVLFQEEIIADLDVLITHFHIAGLPDAESEGTLRVLSDPDTVEPAE